MNKLAFPSIMPVIFTERIVMRAITRDDTEAYFSLCSQEQTMTPYGMRVHQDIRETAKVVEYLANEFIDQRGIRFGIFLSPHEQLIGDCGFWQFDVRRLRAEAGAKISVDFARRGFMKEALLALTNYAFLALGLNSIEANIAVDNVPPQKMMEGLGFIKEGLRRQFSYCAFNNRFKDSVLYSLLKCDFLKE